MRIGPSFSFECLHRHANECMACSLSVQSPTHCRGKATDLRWGIYCMDECKAMSAALLEKLDCALTHDS